MNERQTRIPVTHNGATVVIETNAHFSIVVGLFHKTDSPDELMQELTAEGYAAKPAEYGVRLNYDER